MDSATPARKAALAVLGDVRRRKAHARDLLRTGRRTCDLGERDRAFVQRLVLGSVGAAGLVDTVLASHLHAGVKLEPQVADALHLAVFELLFLDTPSAVAVSQGVELVRGVRPRAAGLANAVLRKVVQEDVPARKAAVAAIGGGEQTVDALALVSGYPAWVVSRVVGERGFAAARDFCLAALQPAPVYAAPNLCRLTSAEAKARLEAQGFCPQETPVADAFELRHPAGLSDCGMVQEAQVVVADLSAQLVARSAVPDEGGCVLEVGQGRGTKSLLMLNEAQHKHLDLSIVGVDSHAFKVRAARRRMEAAGASKRVTCVCMDARSLAGSVLSRDYGADARFDGVFVDAPCSGSGTLRRHPEICWELSELDVCDLAELQLELLVSASERVRAGGVLCYATCSVFTRENEDVVERFLASPVGADFVCASTPVRTTPAPSSPDGHFCARLVRQP